MIKPLFSADYLLRLDNEQLCNKIQKMDTYSLQSAIISLTSTCKALRKQPHITETEKAINKLAMKKFEAAPYNAEIKRLASELNSMQREMEHYRELYYEADQQRGELEAEVKELKAKHPGGRPKTSRDIELILDYVENHTQKDTAAHFGISTSTLYKIMTEAGMVNHRK